MPTPQIIASSLTTILSCWAANRPDVFPSSWRVTVRAVPETKVVYTLTLSTLLYDLVYEHATTFTFEGFDHPGSVNTVTDAFRDALKGFIAALNGPPEQFLHEYRRGGQLGL